MDGTSDVWSAFSRDPRAPGHAALRAGDADREVVRGELSAAYADGRLDHEELDERQDRLAARRTLGELPPLLADLVPERPAGPVAVRRPGSLAGADDAALQRRAEQAWTDDRRRAVVGFLAPTLICWAVWVAVAIGAGATFPWPLIVTAATAIPLVRLSLTRDAHVAEEVRRLERRHDRQLAKERHRDDPDDLDALEGPRG